MTWSIVCHDAETGSFAVAVTTRAFAVGARCPFVRAGIGAVATQASSNYLLGEIVLDLLERGFSPEDAIKAALETDHGKGMRQIHAVDKHGRAAAFTGKNCVTWAGHETHGSFSVAGNMLSNGNVVPATAKAFAAAKNLPLPERLIGALDAGQAAGGDKRGKQSAALLLTTLEDIPEINLRVDDHPEPLEEVRRLLGVYRRDLEPSKHIFPTKANFSGADIEEIEALWKSRGLDLRFTR